MLHWPFQNRIECEFSLLSLFEISPPTYVLTSFLLTHDLTAKSFLFFSKVGTVRTEGKRCDCGESEHSNQKSNQTLRLDCSFSAACFLAPARIVAGFLKRTFVRSWNLRDEDFFREFEFFHVWSINHRVGNLSFS